MLMALRRQYLSIEFSKPLDSALSRPAGHLDQHSRFGAQNTSDNESVTALDDELVLLNNMRILVGESANNQNAFNSAIQHSPQSPT